MRKYFFGIFKLFLLCASPVLICCACQNSTPPESPSTTETISMETTENSDFLASEASKPSDIKAESHPAPILPDANRLKWDYSARLLANTVLLAKDDIVVIQSDDAQMGGFHDESYLVGLDARSGETLWSIDTFSCGTDVQEDLLFVLKDEVGSGETKITAHDTKSGSLVWTSTYRENREATQLFVVGDYLFLKVQYDENKSGLYRIHAKTGKTEEEHEISSKTYVYSNGKDLFLVDTVQGKIQSLDLNFKRKWNIDSIDFIFIDSNDANTSGMVACIKNKLCYIDFATGRVRNYQFEDEQAKTEIQAYIHGEGDKYRYCDDFIIYDGWLSMDIGNRSCLMSTTDSRTIISDEGERLFLAGKDIVSLKEGIVSCRELNGKENKWQFELSEPQRFMNDIILHKDMLILWGSNGYVLCDSQSGNILKKEIYGEDSDGDSIVFYPRAYVFNVYKSEKFLFLPRLFGLECYALE